MKKYLYLNFIFFILIILSGCNFTNSLSEEKQKLIEENELLNKKLDDVYDLVNQVSNVAIRANVMIYTTSYNESPIFGIPISAISGQGSGVIYNANEDFYFVLTNNHVVYKDPAYSKQKFEVYDYLGEKYNGYLLGNSSEYDLAVIYFSKGARELNVLEMAEQNPIIDDTVIAIGQPKGQSNTITFGKVQSYSEISLELENQSSVDFPVIVHTAPINRGSSGGVVINSKLEIVGINFAGSIDPETEISVLSYAIPIEDVKQFLELLNNAINIKKN